MRFRLLFEGEIKPRQKARPAHIHAIRQSFHPQVARLWDHAPLVGLKDKWLLDRVDPDPTPEQKFFYARIEDMGGRRFSSIVAKDLGAELDIIFLRQQARGQLIGEGGDIDNRLKTLFDALRMPSKAEVQQLGNFAANDAQPLHCLLRDDAFIHRVNVETDRLLRDAKARELVAIINVTIVVTRVTWDTLSLTGN